MKPGIAQIQQTYPNNGLGSYWRLSNRSAPFKSPFWKNIYTGFALVGNTLKDAFIELFFVFIFWLIITKMGQGRDLVVSLFEPDGIYNKWRIFYTVLSAVSLSVSMWIIPAFLFQLRDKKKRNHREYRSIFNRHLFFVHRVLPLIPFWLLASVLFHQKGTSWLFTGLSVVQLFLLFWFNEKIKTRMARVIYAGSVVLLLMIAVFYFRSVYKETYTEAKVALSVILYLIAFLLHFFFHEMDREILQRHAMTDEDDIGKIRRHPVNSIFYFILFFVHVFLLVLYFSDYNFRVAPESMMLYIFSMYVFFIDLFLYWVNLSHQRKFMTIFAGIAIFLIYWFSPAVNLNLSHYTLDTIKDSSALYGHPRMSFEQRYQLLKQQIDSNKSGQPYPIILVSGQGGGSRAAVWFTQNLINFDYYTRGKFREHIFSISTVSGSSAGLGSLFTYWELSDKNDIDAGWLEFPMKVYANNFVGSSVKGMLLTDLWKTAIPFGSFESDRNTILQDEESYFNQKAALEILQHKKLRDETNIPFGDRILTKDFMNFFYRKSGDTLQLKDRPVVLINSTRSNDGRRGIISPIKLTDDVFNDAIDIAGYLYEDSVCNYKNDRLCYTRKRNISLGQACNLSELFPLFSAPAYIDSLGSFVDGAYHENSGLKTTLDVYLQLKKLFERDKMDPAKYAIYIVYLKNDSEKKELYKPVNSELPFALPLKALSSQPFAGSESYFEEKARFVEDRQKNVEFLSIQLDNQLIKEISDSTTTVLNKSGRDIEEEILYDLRTESDDNTLNFPLARWLSKSVIKRMRLATFPIKVNQQEDDKRMFGLLKKIISIHGTRHAPYYPFMKWTPNAVHLILRQQDE
jgi:hypothetical protein